MIPEEVAVIAETLANHYGEDFDAYINIAWEIYNNLQELNQCP